MFEFRLFVSWNLYVDINSRTSLVSTNQIPAVVILSKQTSSLLSKPRVPRLQWGPGHIWGHRRGSLSAERFSGGAGADWGDNPPPWGTERRLRSSPPDLSLCRTASPASVDPPTRSCSDPAAGTRRHNLQETRWRTQLPSLASTTKQNKRNIHLPDSCSYFSEKHFKSIIYKKLN